MTSVGNDMSGTSPAALDDAAGWMLQLQQAPQDLELCRRFEAWRSQSAQHRRAWEQTEAMWNALGAVPTHYDRILPVRAGSANVAAMQWRTGQRAATTPGRKASLPKLAGIAVMVSTCIMLFFGPSTLIWLKADQMTATAEMRSVRLDDGSTVVLGADSAITSTFHQHSREVTLLAGEAYFDVVQDGRPFTVTAGDVGVEVLGTTFDVRMTSAGTDVALAHGEVRAVFGAGDTRSEAFLQPGEMFSLDHDSGVGTKSTIATDDIATWREGRLYVTDLSIGAVVELIQRYHSAWIAMPDRGLAVKRVSGIYDLTKPDQALRALVGPYGGKVRSASPLLRVVSRL